MSVPSKRPKQQAAKLQAGLLAAKGSPKSGDAGEEETALQESPDQTSPASEPAKPAQSVKASDIFYGKGDATAATFRPWYWSYEKSDGDKDGTPAHDDGAARPSAEAPPADAKLLQERLAAATAALKARAAGAPPPTVPASETASPQAELAPEQLHVAAPTTEVLPAETPDMQTTHVEAPAAQSVSAEAPAAEPMPAETQAAELAPAPSQAAEPTIADAPTIEAMPLDAPAVEPLPTETSAPEPMPGETPAAELAPAEAGAAEPVAVDASAIEPAPVESWTPTPLEIPTAEPIPAETPTTEPPIEMSATETTSNEAPAIAPEPPAPPPEPVPEVRPERPHQRARRALREQAVAAETAEPAPPPKRRKAAAEEDHAPALRAEEQAAALAAEERAATLAAEERVAALAAEERAAALAEEARLAALIEEERLAAARAAADAQPATPDDLASTIETVMNRRRYTDPVEREKAMRSGSGSGNIITGNSLLAELQAAREARGVVAALPVSESDAASSIPSSRPLLDRVLAFGGIALILVVAFLALSPAAQYAPVARLTHLFN